jgi:hypothetical protein
MIILKKLWRFITQGKYPERLRIAGRIKLSPSSFHDDDKLYRAFDKDDFDNNEEIKLETIKFPDVSCNWGKLSDPQDIRIRKNGRKTDGCYSFSVLTSRFKKIATPVHDPIDDCVYPNYAHVEVRALYANEDILHEPPKGRKIKPNSNKLIYRQNIKNSLTIECKPQ